MFYFGKLIERGTCFRDEFEGGRGGCIKMKTASRLRLGRVASAPAIFTGALARLESVE